MNVLFLCYSKCSTCKKAERFLNDHNIVYEKRDIKENNPTKDELKEWYQKSNLPLKKFFNTSGLVYKEMNLKDHLKNYSEEKQIEILSQDGMLVKRPIVVGKDFVLCGFNIEEWEKNFK